MNAKTSARILVAASVVYGLAIGLLGALGSPATTLIAIIGAVVLGALWVIRGLFIDRDRTA